jgi:hypothetical protein
MTRKKGTALIPLGHAVADGHKTSLRNRSNRTDLFAPVPELGLRREPQLSPALGLRLGSRS